MPVVQGVANIVNAAKAVDGAKEAATSFVTMGKVVAVTATATLVGVGWYGRQIKHAYKKELESVQDKGVSAMVEKKFARREKPQEVNIQRTFGPLQPVWNMSVGWAADWMPMAKYSLDNPETPLLYLIPFSGHGQMQTSEDRIAATIIAGVPEMICRIGFGEAPIWVRLPGLVAVSTQTVRSWVMEQPIIGDMVKGISSQVQNVEDEVVSVIAHQYKRAIVGSLTEFEKTELGSEWIGKNANPIVKCVVASFISEKGKRMAEDLAVRTFRGTISMVVQGLLIKGVNTPVATPQPIEMAVRVFAKVAAGGAYQSRREIALRVGASLIEQTTGSWIGANAFLYGGQAIFFVVDKVAEHNQPESKVEIIDDDEALIYAALDDFEKGENGETVGESPVEEYWETYNGGML